MKNNWCEILNIKVPNLERVKSHSRANSYTLLMVALLERGEPMTLNEVATRFEQAGVAHADRALKSLKRCRPARPPIYRVDDRYSIDPHDDHADLWMFRLDLRPPKRLKTVQPDPEPLPGHDVPLLVVELDEAWKDACLNNWSAKRLILAVLEANGRPMYLEEIIKFVEARTKWYYLNADVVKFRTRTSPIEVLPDGCLAIDARMGDAMIPVRKAVRDKIESVRKAAAKHPGPAVIKAMLEKWQQEQAAQVAESAKMRRGFLFAFPQKRPAALTLLDVNRHKLTTFIGKELSSVAGQLADFDIIGAIEIRGLIGALGFDCEKISLAELGPPQKTKQLNKQGRKLKITTELLIQGTCGISRPLGDKTKLASYLRDGRHTKLRRRLEANVKALFAFYEYGRLHGAVRLRWGFLDEMLVVPWTRRVWSELFTMTRIAQKSGRPLEVVVGNAPGWEDPWSRGQLAFVRDSRLVDEAGLEIYSADIQRARLKLG